MRASDARRRTRAATVALRVRWAGAVRVVATALIASSLSLASPAFGEDEPEHAFTPTERELLDSGELVRRPLRARRPGIDLIGGSSWEVIDEKPELVWRAVQDTTRYPKMLPAVLEATVVARDGDERVLFVRQGKWPIFVSYYMLVRTDEAQRSMRFEMDQNRPHSGNAAWGFVRVVPYGNGKTLLAFGMAADVGRGIIAAVARGTIEYWMLRVPWTIKRYLESGGANHYRAPAAARPSP